MKALSELAKDALELPVAQRRVLARILLELSEEDQDFSPEIDAAWEQEITRRIEAIKAGRVQSRSFEAALNTKRDQRWIDEALASGPETPLRRADLDKVRDRVRARAKAK